ncbi:MAG: tryptophan-rich sensory protein [Chloroflexota bacterium]
MKNTTILKIINIVAFVLVLVANWGANTEFVPNTVGDLGESRAIFFLPAGYVFAIWGVIYSGLLAYVIYQAVPSKRENGVVEKIGWWFVINCVANISWLILFVYNQIWLSTVAMLVLLLSLVVITRNLGVGKSNVSWAERLAVHVPFSIYLGWISVATVANFSTALFDNGFVTSFLGIDAALWASVMMVVASVLAFAMLYFRRDIAYALVIVWATYGINARSFETDLYSVVSSLDAGLVNTTALAIAVIVGIGAVIALGATVLRGQQASVAVS